MLMSEILYLKPNGQAMRVCASKLIAHTLVPYVRLRTYLPQSFSNFAWYPAGAGISFGNMARNCLMFVLSSSVLGIVPYPLHSGALALIRAMRSAAAHSS